MIHVVPCTIKSAVSWIATHHRHLPTVNGGRFAVAIADDNGAIRGVGLVGNGPRVWEGSTKMVITRVATDGVPNGCSMIYGALCRAGKAFGYTEAWTYTLPDEPGTSLRAAGFMHQGISKGGEYDRPSRHRKPAIRSEPKQRWMRQL